MRKLLRLMAVISAALCATGTALAGPVITFDALDPSYGSLAPSFPFIGSGDFMVEGAYAIGVVSTKAGAQAGDLVGAVLDGSDPFMCFGVVCPGNNPTQYLAALNDGLPYIFRLDNGLFHVTQFDASFIAAQGVAVLPTALLLRVQGFNGATLAGQQDFLLPGPTSGDYDFSTYMFSDAFAGTAFSEIDFIGYACTTPSNCTRALNQAQFGLDNITFADPTVVPEPSSLALVGLALIGAGSARRRISLQARAVRKLQD